MTWSSVKHRVRCPAACNCDRWDRGFAPGSRRNRTTCLAAVQSVAQPGSEQLSAGRQAGRQWQWLCMRMRRALSCVTARQHAGRSSGKKQVSPEWPKPDGMTTERPVPSLIPTTTRRRAELLGYRTAHHRPLFPTCNRAAWSRSPRPSSALSCPPHLSS